MTGPHFPTKLTRALRWTGTALPLGICLSIWLFQPASAWLATVHHAIGVAVLAWTALRIARRPSGLRPSRLAASMRARLQAARLGVVMVYALLILQPVLELAGWMGAGHPVILCGFIIIPALPVNAALAGDVAQMQGLNAMLLLVLIGAQVVAELQPANRYTT
jgi:cytochrome b561